METPLSHLPRRDFLKISVGGLALGAFLAAHESLFGELAPPPFQYGVASGDPLPNQIIIWTRVTPLLEAVPGSGLGPDVAVTWQVARDAAFAFIARAGTITASATADHTVKIDVTGLLPGTAYFYRFSTAEGSSAVGRFTTAPSYRVRPGRMRWAVLSCSNFEGGYFSAYKYVAQREDLDFVLHLGDYLYEYAEGEYGPGAKIGRPHDPPNEILTLQDYRRRHACYKRDPDLRTLHARYPFITCWDDHEVANDSYATGAENHTPGVEGDYLVRRQNAYRAYFEWMPIRKPDPINEPNRIYRRLKFGTLVDLEMLDLRQYRSQQPAQVSDTATIQDPARTMTGAAQSDWLRANLSTSTSVWKVLGNSVMVTPIVFPELTPAQAAAVAGLIALERGQPYNVDQWDGYFASQRSLISYIGQQRINNVVFLTGDIHSSWACDVPLDPETYADQNNSVAVELVTTSITADNLDEITEAPPRTVSVSVEETFKAANPYVKLLEFDSHGYAIVEATSAHLQMDWFYISDREDPNATQSYAQSWQVLAGQNRVTPGVQIV